MFQQLPVAIIAAREDDALTHGQVLFGLVKPTKDMDQVESTAAMVNVIPKKRIYRMESPEELDIFMSELMKRPLVLQPSAYIGRGLAVFRCTLYTNEERWIMLVNQTHPKIRSRIQMGIDSAKTKMYRGEPFVLQISLNSFLKRMYLSRLTKANLDKRFTFIDFVDAEIVIRFPGDAAKRGLAWEMKNSSKIHFEFEDLLPSEITRRTVSAAESEWRSPALRVILPDELCTLLPDWTFEMIDPLDGVVIPNEEEQLEGAVGGYDISPENVKLIHAPPASNKVVGRAKRKANQAGTKVEIPVELHCTAEIEAPSPSYGANRKTNQAGNNVAMPVELHAANDGRPQNMYSPMSGVPSSPHSRGRTPSANQPYEDMNRQRGPDHYSFVSGQGPKSPSSGQAQRPARSPGYKQGTDSDYEPVNVSGQYSQQYSPHGLPSPRTPVTPRTPQSPGSSTSRSREDRYNTELVNKRSTQQTYLTDDDQGGFTQPAPRSPYTPTGHVYDEPRRVHDGGISPHSPRGPQTPNNKYDSNYNQSGYDRYGQNSDSRDRYANQEAIRQGQNRQGYPQSSEKMGPIPAPRGFHRHQGSGRSDTSASDSGFGENENGNGYNNHAYQDDSPHRHSDNEVEDIMAKHKALAAKMMYQNGQGVQSPHQRQNYNNDSSYNKELKKWRENINDLEESAGTADVNFSRSRARVNSNEEPMAESFI